jgi:ATP-dependent helicase/nuclease subunit B
MLRIVTGRYHPDLEAALVEEVRSLKASDPLAPLAIVIPSDPLRRRMQQVLCGEGRLALLDVHILTFHQLALQVAHEWQAASDDDGARVDVMPDLFFGHLLRQLARRRLPAWRELGLDRLTLGGWAALWATVRDLKDAAVDPADALRAVADGSFGDDDAHKLQALFMLYAAVREVGRTLCVGTADDLAAAVTPVVPRSSFLARLARICYYGFYDLTQVQLSFFEAVTRAVPATLYFPLTERPAYAFARRFFERHLARLAPAPQQVGRAAPRPERAGLRQEPGRRIWSVVGTEEELTLVCKEILTLVETNGYRFEEIGVVARTLDPYRTDLKRTFDRHRVPFVTTATVPLLRQPAAKTVLMLASLPLSRFHRTAVLEVLTAPCYRSDRVAESARRAAAGRPAGSSAALEPRPDLWRLAVHSLGITRGEDEWQRLRSAGTVHVTAGLHGEAADETIEGTGGLRIEAAQLRLLAELTAGLLADLTALPREGRVGALTDAVRDVVARHLAIPGLSSEGEAVEGEPDAAHAVGAAIAQVFRQVRELDRLEEAVTWEEWVELFTQAMERAAMPVEPGGHAGVAVLDAMDARGLSFRALFVLGLNENQFPRAIREDAFLRDRHRRVLAETLGYKIDEKLGGYEEERLLFALLEEAARERLYLSYQRADAEGRPLAVSSYLEPDLRDGDGRPREPDLNLPRRLSDRLSLPLFAPPLLTREELGIGLIVRSRDPAELLEATGRSGLLFGHGAALVRELERVGPPGPHDGRTGLLARHWAEVVERGLAPTALECYAQCPFQYFAAHVLQLEPIRVRVGDDLPPPALGELCHETLRRCYARLVGEGWPHRELETERRRAVVSAAAAEVFAAYARTHGAGYPLLWQLTKETVARLVDQAALADQDDYRQSGFEPVAFEVEAEGALDRMDAAFAGLRVHGRLDRVDRRLKPPALRVVDYKYRTGQEMSKKDRDLAASAVRGLRLQPPLYSVMRPSALPPPHPAPETVAFVFLAPRWDPPVARSLFAASIWTEPAGRQLVETLRVLIEGVRAGEYLILPGDYCDRCDYAPACRRFHGPTWWRAHAAASAKALRRLRTLKVERPRGGRTHEP